MKKKSKAPQAGKSAASPEPAVSLSTVPALAWPAEFPSPRTTKLTIGLLGVVGMAALAVWLAKFYFPGNAMLASIDMLSLVVGTGFILVFGAGLVHPAFGLAMVAFLWHWLDGITYPGDTAYFIGAILFFFVLWGVRMVLGGGSIRFGIPAMLLAGFLAVAAATATVSCQLDTTYNRLVLWAGFLALFMVTSNALRSRTAILIVLAGWMAGELCHAVYAIIQFEFVFDYTRRELIARPEMLERYFDERVATPEVLRRLNINRAFGTMLYPNALAAFLVLAMPAGLGAAAYGVARHNALAADVAKGAEKPGRFGLVVGGIVWAIVLYITGLYTMMAHTEMDVALMFGIAFGTACFFGILHAAIASAYARKCGVAAARNAFFAYFFIFLLPIQAMALWLTFSRGAMLSLVMAVLFTAFLLLFRGRLRTALGIASLIAVAAVIGGFAAGALSVPAARAQEAAVPVQVEGGVATSENAANTAALPAAPNKHELALEASKLLEEGANLGVNELLDPSSFALRLTYWRVGVRMALDNLLTGVGLGNFAVLYPKYQMVDDGDVQMAHNDYLQALCETGIFGFLFFTGFFAWFVLWGARRILAEPDTGRRLLLAGLYAGVLAFLAHSLLDFNLNNPSLVFYIILSMGLFYAVSAMDAGPAPTRGAHQAVMIPLLVIAALVFGTGLRIYRQNYALSGARINVASMDRMDTYFKTAQVFLTQTTAFALDRRQARIENRAPKVAVPQVPLVYALPLLRPVMNKQGAALDERKLLEYFATLAVRTKAGGWRPLGPDEPLGNYVWLRLDRRPWYAFELAREAVDGWVAEIESIDKSFPHRPDLASLLTDWYTLLEQNSQRPKDGTRHDLMMAKNLEWARVTMERSPERSEYHSRYARLLWTKASKSPAEARETYLREAILHFRQAQRLRPEASCWTNWDLASVLRSFGEYLISAGAEAEGRRLIEEGKPYEEKGNFIQAERHRLGLPV